MPKLRDRLSRLLARIRLRLPRSATEVTPEPGEVSSEAGLWKVWLLHDGRVKRMHFFPRRETAEAWAKELLPDHGDSAGVYLQNCATEAGYILLKRSKAEGAVELEPRYRPESVS